VIELLHHLDINDPPVADRQRQPPKATFFQPREDIEHEHSLSVADAVRYLHEILIPILVLKSWDAVTRERDSRKRQRYQLVTLAIRPPVMVSVVAEPSPG